jgi:hypothetical protein
VRGELSEGRSGEVVDQLDFACWILSGHDALEELHKVEPLVAGAADATVVQVVAVNVDPGPQDVLLNVVFRREKAARRRPFRPKSVLSEQPGRGRVVHRILLAIAPAVNSAASVLRALFPLAMNLLFLTVAILLVGGLPLLQRMASLEAGLVSMTEPCRHAGNLGAVSHRVGGRRRTLSVTAGQDHRGR